jgi:hypothetical protein
MSNFNVCKYDRKRCNQLHVKDIMYYSVCNFFSKNVCEEVSKREFTNIEPPTYKPQDPQSSYGQHQQETTCQQCT